MRAPLTVAFCCAVFVVVAFARPAAACSYIGLTPHTIDQAMQATDQSAPVLTALALDGVYRSPESSGCSGNSCEGGAALGLRVTANDDMTAPAQMGFLIASVGGRTPPGLALPVTPVRASGELIWLHWSDNDPDSAIDFTLSVSPVDLAGNVGAAQSVRVQNGSDGGCRVAGGSRAAGRWGGTLVLLALAGLAVRSRRRR